MDLPYDIWYLIYNLLDFNNKKNLLLTNKYLTGLRFLLFQQTRVKFKKYLPVDVFNNIKYLYRVNTKILPTNLIELEFNNSFNKYLDKIKFPESLVKIKFGNNFNKPVLNLPNNLIYLEFGNKFNQKNINIKLPANLEFLFFGKEFNKSLDNFELPANLKKLTFGKYFNKPINKLKINKNLEFIKFGLYFTKNFDILSNYNITSLIFRNFYNIYDAKYPKTLQYLKYGNNRIGYQEFRIRNINLIQNITRLSAYDTNFRSHLLTFQNLTRLDWYFSTDQVDYYRTYKYSGIKLPISLKYLVLGGYFNFPLPTIRLDLLINLEKLIFSKWFDYIIDNYLPRNLKYLDLGQKFSRIIKIIPANLKILKLPAKYKHNINWPNIQVIK